jgi:hypothetical protein
MKMYDMCCGLKGASEPFQKRGWDVITLDIDSKFKPDIICDIRNYSIVDETPDLIWFSPPCDEFSREFMPWSRTGKTPDITLVKHCRRIIEETKPYYWVVENVLGAVNYFKPILGNYRCHFGPFYLWGNFPVPHNTGLKNFKKKESYSSIQKDERAKIPIEVGNSIAKMIESTIELNL